jgi:hypothetical protein
MQAERRGPVPRPEFQGRCYKVNSLRRFQGRCYKSKLIMLQTVEPIVIFKLTVHLISSLLLLLSLSLLLLLLLSLLL